MSDGQLTVELSPKWCSYTRGLARWRGILGQISMSDGKASVWTGLGVGILTLLVGGVLWQQIGGVASSLEATRHEMATYRTGDASRIDASSHRLDQIIAEVSDTRVTVNNIEILAQRILREQDEIKHDLDDAEERITNTGSDILVAFRLMIGESPDIPLLWLASESARDDRARHFVAQFFVRGRIVKNRLTVYPESPEVRQILTDSGWRPANPNNPEAGYVQK